MICPKCAEPLALSATSCACGWISATDSARSPKPNRYWKEPDAPWQLYECTQCGYTKAYRAWTDEHRGVCRRCQVGPATRHEPRPASLGR